jgi:hypothetical protein
VLSAHTFNKTTPGRYIPPQKKGALIDKYTKLAPDSNVTTDIAQYVAGFRSNDVDDDTLNKSSSGLL